MTSVVWKGFARACGFGEDPGFELLEVAGVGAAATADLISVGARRAVPHLARADRQVRYC
jgi:hypothetical protein